MPDADPKATEQTPQFRSPKRALVRAFRLSRDRWKQKANQRRQQIKTLQIRVRDLQVSRDLWKDKALHLQQQLQHFQGSPSCQPDDCLDSPTTASRGQQSPQDTTPCQPDHCPVAQPPPATSAQAAPPPPQPGPVPATAAEAAAPKKAPRARR